MFFHIMQTFMAVYFYSSHSVTIFKLDSQKINETPFGTYIKRRSDFHIPRGSKGSEGSFNPCIPTRYRPAGDGREHMFPR